MFEIKALNYICISIHGIVPTEKNQRVNLVKLSKIASHFIKDHRMPTGRKDFLLLKDINENMKENYNLKSLLR